MQSIYRHRHINIPTSAPTQLEAQNLPKSDPSGKKEKRQNLWTHPKQDETFPPLPLCHQHHPSFILYFLPFPKGWNGRLL